MSVKACVGSDMPWYALSCFSSAEDSIANKIGDRAYVPKRIIWKKRRGRKREKRSYALIPGYILVNMDIRDSVYDLVRRDHRVFGFVEACGEPLTIRDSEIDYLRRKEALGHYDETKDILYKLIGGRFDIHDGALDGKSVRVISIKNRDIIMEVDGFAMPIAIAIDSFEKTRHTRIIR